MKAQPTPSIDPWRFALDAIDTGQRTVLVTVVDHSGSVPGVTGTFVIVTESGQAGTIGGGVAEHRMVDRARDPTEKPALAEFVHTEHGDGTLCSGRQLFSFLPLSGSHRHEIEEIIATLQDHATGTLTLTDGGLAFTRGAARPTSLDRRSDGWTVNLPLGFLDTLTIIGGGHVALALSRVMATLAFRVVVLDNRPELPTMAANPFAHRMDVVDYSEIAAHVPEGDRSWVVVMTYGHVHDREVVERLLGHDVRYLGLMGSAAKIGKLFADMAAAGCDPAALDRVRAPVGIAIGSHTPEEIAVSVAAELIGIRNGAID